MSRLLLLGAAEFCFLKVNAGLILGDWSERFRMAWPASAIDILYEA